MYYLNIDCKRSAQMSNMSYCCSGSLMLIIMNENPISGKKSLDYIHQQLIESIRAIATFIKLTDFPFTIEKSISFFDIRFVLLRIHNKHFKILIFVIFVSWYLYLNALRMYNCYFHVNLNVILQKKITQEKRGITELIYTY